MLTFLRNGAKYRERCSIAGDGLGKIDAGADEVTLHISGVCPDQWIGKRFSKPWAVWAAAACMASTTRRAPSSMGLVVPINLVTLLFPPLLKQWQHSSSREIVEEILRLSD